MATFYAIVPEWTSLTEGKNSLMETVVCVPEPRFTPMLTTPLAGPGFSFIWSPATTPSWGLLHCGSSGTFDLVGGWGTLPSPTIKPRNACTGFGSSSSRVLNEMRLHVDGLCDLCCSNHTGVIVYRGNHWGGVRGSQALRMGQLLPNL